MTAREQAMNVIDDLGDPAKMTKQEWVDFLTEIIDGCQSRREAAEEELRKKIMTGKERLEYLANFLESIPNNPRWPRSFDLERWFSVGICGTTACAIGEACRIDRFREEWLGMDIEGFPTYTCQNPWRVYDRWDAVTLFFEIDIKVALDLFVSSRYPREDRRNPLAVVARIREFLEKGEVDLWGAKG